MEHAQGLKQAPRVAILWRWRGKVGPCVDPPAWRARHRTSGSATEREGTLETGVDLGDHPPFVPQLHGRLRERMPRDDRLYDLDDESAVDTVTLGPFEIKILKIAEG